MYSYSELYTYLRAVRYAHHMERVMPRFWLAVIVASIVWACVVGSVNHKISRHVSRKRKAAKKQPFSKRRRTLDHVLGAILTCLPFAVGVCMLSVSLLTRLPPEPPITASGERAGISHWPESVVLQDLTVKSEQKQLPKFRTRLASERRRLKHAEKTETFDEFQRDAKSRRLRKRVSKQNDRLEALDGLCKNRRGANHGLNALTGYMIVIKPGYAPKIERVSGVKSNGAPTVHLSGPYRHHAWVYDCLNLSDLGKGGYVRLPKLKRSFMHFPYLNQ